MSQSKVCEYDFLAKGLTESPTAWGVPFKPVIANFFINVLLGFISCLIFESLFPIVIFLTFLVSIQIWMMKVSHKDIRLLDILIKKPGGGKKLGFVKEYSPFIKSSIKTILSRSVERGAFNKVPYDVMLDEHTLSTKDGLLVQFLSLDGIAFSTCDGSDIDLEKSIFHHFLKGLDNKNVMIHTFLKKRKTNAYPAGDQNQTFSREFDRQYKSKFTNKKFFQHQYYIALIYKPIKDPVHGFMESIERFCSKWSASEGGVNKGVEVLNEISEKLIGRLDNYKIYRLGRCELNGFVESQPVSFISEILNGEVRKRKEPTASIEQQLSYTFHQFAQRKGVIRIEKPDGSSKYAAMLSLKEYPSLSRAGMFNALLSVKCELLLSQSFVFKRNSRKAIKDVGEQAGRLKQSKEASIDEVDELLLTSEELKSGDIKLGAHNLAICVLADSESELNEHINEIDNALSEKEGLCILREHDGLECAFWSLLPGNLKYEIRNSDISSLNYAGFTAPHNHPKGRLKGNHWGDALMMLETNSLTPYAFNYHVGQVATSILVGPSGTGKTSVLAASLIASQKYGGWRFIFDRDFGMSSTVRALGGSYNELKVGVKTGMAPLQLEDSSESRAFNIMLLKRLLSNNDDLKASEEKLIEKVIDRAYSLKKEDRTYKNIAPFFGVALEDSLRERFDRWHSDGANAWAFDNESDSFDMGSKVYGLDITNLLSEEFDEVKTPIFIYLFERIARLLDGSPAMIFIPEGWQVLGDKYLGPQVDSMSRTNRKNNVALIIDTQSMEEFSKKASKGGRAIARESVTTLFFANPKADENDYESFSLSDKEFSIIKHELPSMQKEHYFLLRQDHQSLIARVPLHGMDEMLDVLSPSKHKITIGNIISNHVKKEKEWLEAYHKEIKRFKEEFDQNIDLWKQAYEESL